MSSFHYHSENTREIASSEIAVMEHQQEDVSPREQTSSDVKLKPKLSKSKIVSLIFLNALVWGAAFLYLKNASPVYQSKWGVIVLGAEQSEAVIQLPDAGKATSTSNGSRAKSFEDARSDYIYIAESSEVINKAAEIAQIEAKDFGKPKITADDGSAVISFVQTAPAPELVHRKSMAMYTALSDYLEELRKSSTYQKKRQNNLLLLGARDKVKQAQNQLASYQAQSGFESDRQLDDLAASIEELRRLRSQFSAQAQGLDKRFRRLSRGRGRQSQNASDAYRLKGDPIYQQQISEYSRLKAEYSSLSSDLSSQHPQVLKVQDSLNNAEQALLQRSSMLLSRNTDIDSLTSLESLISDPQVSAVYGEFFKEATQDQAERENLISQSESLEGEIKRMSSRLAKLSQDKLVVDRLKRELQVAEAVLASKVAKLDLSSDDINSIYPPIKLIVEPTVPSKDASIAPNIRMILLTALAGSFLLTMGILLFWQDKVPGVQNDEAIEPIFQSDAY